MPAMSTELLCVLLACFSLLVLGYIYVGYPLLVWVLARIWGRPAVTGEFHGSISVLIVAHNEARVLPRKIDNLLTSTAAHDILEILIGSDGSTDDMVALLTHHSDPRVKVVPFGNRRGKPAVLNDLALQARGEVLVFADARQEFHVGTLAALQAHFIDPTVGVVSGELILVADANSTAASEGIGFYWKYEKLIRKAESAFRSVPGATGACYALRRSLFQPIPANTLLDDVTIPMQAIVRGYRCRFEPKALAFDKPSQSTRQEGIRKRRTIAGNVQLMWQHPSWLLPWQNPIWFEFVSHKLLRLVSPLLLLLLFGTTVWLSGQVSAAQSWYQAAVVGQFLFLLAAAAGWLSQRYGRRNRLLGVCLMFLALNWTTLLALWDAARSKYRVTWQRAV